MFEWIDVGKGLNSCWNGFGCWKGFELIEKTLVVVVIFGKLWKFYSEKLSYWRVKLIWIVVCRWRFNTTLYS
jgi:hypothetical protein